VSDVLSYIIVKKDPIALRRIIIERASEFGSDYRALLHGLFNAVYDEKISSEIKKNHLIELASGLYKIEMCMDKEICAYATLLKMMQ
jgi:hypothetical protein